MSKYTVQDISEENSVNVFKGSLDNNFFLIDDFGPKDKYPDIDGQIRLRDGKGNYLNKYLHFQLKGVMNLKNHKFFCKRTIIDYLLSTNVPTLLIVVDQSTSRAYWFFMDDKFARRSDLSRDKKGRTLYLAKHVIDSNSPELNEKWARIAKKDNYEDLSNALDTITANYQKSVVKCVGLLYLLRKVNKADIISLFNKFLGIDGKKVELVIDDLATSGIITSTSNLYLVENEQLGLESLYELINDLNLEQIFDLFKEEKERSLILSQLAKVKHQKIEEFLNGLANELLDFTSNPSNNDDLFVNIELLEDYAYRVPKTIIKITKSIIKTKTPMAALTYENILGPITGKSHEEVVTKCIELLERIRYFDVKKVLNLLVSQSLSENTEIKKKSTETLIKLAQYNIHVLKQAGLYAQVFILNELEKWSDNKLRKHAFVVSDILEKLLQPSFEGTSLKDYTTFVMSFGPLAVTDELKSIRLRASALLQKLYNISSDIVIKLKVLDSLQDATHTPHQGVYGDDVEQMVANDTKLLIDYYIGIVPTADNQVLKEIEGQTYWFKRRFGHLPNINELETMIASNLEYQMFRVFVGSDHDFISEEHNWEKAKAERLAKIQDFINDVTESNFADWQSKILSVASNYSSSGDYEFRYFNLFLNELGKQKPDIALRLVRENEADLESFLVHIVMGVLISASPDAAKELIRNWVDSGRHLSISALVFAYNQMADLALLRRILAKANQLGDSNATISVIRAIIENTDDAKNLKTLFLRAIRSLTKVNNTDWPFYVWRRQHPLFDLLEDKEIDIILKNLVVMPNIDYHVEEILTPIAQRYPEKIIGFFEKRVAKGKTKKPFDFKYHAIPYELDELSNILNGQAKVIIPLICRWYGKNNWLYSWEASHLIKAIFPSFNPDLEKTLIDMLKQHDDKKTKAALSVIRAYEGQKFIHRVCREIIKRNPNNKRFKDEVMVALSQTRVVSGEYGFVNAFKQKKAAIQSWKTEKSKAVRDFVLEYEKYLDDRIDFEKKRADEDVELMKKGIR